MSGSAKASKMRMLVMDGEDANAFSRVLCDAYPGIRFMLFEYWTRRVNKAGHPWENQKPPNLRLQYYDSLGDPDEWRFRVWVALGLSLSFPDCIIRPVVDVISLKAFGVLQELRIVLRNYGGIMGTWMNSGDIELWGHDT